VQAGENLYRISLKYGVTVAELAEANGITNADALSVGTELTIPGCDGTGTSDDGTTDGADDVIHVVQTGENLYRIALDYGLSWQVIANYNGITNPDSIFEGQELRIPGQ
jgi:LysM repeat protein